MVWSGGVNFLNVNKVSKDRLQHVHIFRILYKQFGSIQSLLISLLDGDTRRI